jgi:hypothetical protein
MTRWALSAVSDGDKELVLLLAFFGNFVLRETL